MRSLFLQFMGVEVADEMFEYFGRGFSIMLQTLVMTEGSYLLITLGLNILTSDSIFKSALLKDFFRFSIMLSKVYSLSFYWPAISSWNFLIIMETSESFFLFLSCYPI